MARLPRISPAGIPVHVIQRGSNRQACFVCDEDHGAYAGWLKDYSRKYKVDIHAWVMMTNHVHLLCTPWREGGISQMMQSLDRRYDQYFKFTYDRSGTLREEIRDNTHKGMAIGNERFKEELAALTGRRLQSRMRGRPVGWRKGSV